MKVVQCWDDGLVDDIRLIEILRRYGARAVFALNPGLYGLERSFGWTAGDREVWRLSLPELVQVYDGFEIASHSMTHPNLTDLTPEQIGWEVHESRHRLEAIFHKPVSGFCYPFNACNDTVTEVVRAAGYRWARSGTERREGFISLDFLHYQPNCHFLAEDFWPRYDHERAWDGVFFFWGHSCELASDAMWIAFEKTIAGISADPAATWCNAADLM